MVVGDGETEQMRSINSSRQSIFGFLSFTQTIIQLKSLSSLIQQLNLTLGEKEPLKSARSWWAEGTKRSRKRKSTESTAHLLFSEWNEYHEQRAFPIRISSFLM